MKNACCKSSDAKLAGGLSDIKIRNPGGITDFFILELYWKISSV